MFFVFLAVFGSAFFCQENFKVLFSPCAFIAFSFFSVMPAVSLCIAAFCPWSVVILDPSSVLYELSVLNMSVCVVCLFFHDYCVSLLFPLFLCH